MPFFVTPWFFLPLLSHNHAFAMGQFSMTFAALSGFDHGTVMKALLRCTLVTE